MRLGLLTLLWKRPEITELVLSYYEAMDLDGITLIKHAVGSEGNASRDLAERNGWHYTEHPNQPFTDKWNTAMAPFAEWDVEGVMIIGSDNLHNPECFYMNAGLISAGIESIRIYRHYSLDVITRRMFCYKNVTIGTGRVLSSALLDRVQWRPWRSGFRRNADGHLNNNIWPYERRVAPIYTPHKRGAASVDLKSGEDMHSFDAIQNGLRVETVDYQAFFSRYFPDAKPAVDCLTQKVCN